MYVATRQAHPNRHAGLHQILPWLTRLSTSVSASGFPLRRVRADAGKRGEPVGSASRADPHGNRQMLHSTCSCRAIAATGAFRCFPNGRWGSTDILRWMVGMCGERRRCVECGACEDAAFRANGCWRGGLHNLSTSSFYIDATDKSPSPRHEHPDFELVVRLPAQNAAVRTRRTDFCRWRLHNLFFERRGQNRRSGRGRRANGVRCYRGGAPGHRVSESGGNGRRVTSPAWMSHSAGGTYRRAGPAGVALTGETGRRYTFEALSGRFERSLQHHGSI